MSGFSLLESLSSGVNCIEEIVKKISFYLLGFRYRYLVQEGVHEIIKLKDAIRSSLCGYCTFFLMRKRSS